MRRKRKGENIDGILLIDKPLGITSHIALKRFQFLLEANKAGHTGSLDPLATGMLPLCFGEATKLCRYLLEEDKCYQVVMALGKTTSTGDIEGEVLATKPVPSLTIEKISHMLSLFKGKLSQIPPMYSAVKFEGQPLYKLARKGKTIERASREIVIHDLQLDEFDTTQGEMIALTVTCSKGTYIRTLVEDMGNYLGCGAHVTFLRRLWVSTFQKDKMIRIEEFTDLPLSARREQLIPTQDVLSLFFPRIVLPLDLAVTLRRGQSVNIEPCCSTGMVTLVTEAGDFLGLGELRSDGRVAPKRLIAVTE